MTTFALFPNPTDPAACEQAFLLRQHLEEIDCDVFVRDSAVEPVGAPPLSSISYDQIDFLITLGGDGTILRVVHEYPKLYAPILAVNMGTIGFMADTSIEDLHGAIELLLRGEYEVNDRMMLEGIPPEGAHCFAVNEITVHRGQIPGIIQLALHVDGRYVNTFAADGLIISTPTGSTAYSLAAGGPIVAPDLEAVVITPISPHTISNRPIVLAPKCTIQIQYLEGSLPIQVAFDGVADATLETGDLFRIIRARRGFPLITLRHHDYFTALRSKLGWSGQLKRKS